MLEVNGKSIEAREFHRRWARYALKKLGFPSFRGHQEDIILDLMAGYVPGDDDAVSHDVIAVMPTGTGKSLTYQIPALLADLAGDNNYFRPLIVVISPLKALQIDQVREARSLGIEAVCLNGDTTRNEAEVVIENLENYRLLFVAPERIKDQRLWRQIYRLVSLIVIDEAHCVTTWGHDFRPAFARIATLIRATREVKGFHAPVLMLTATATDAVLRNVLDTLGLSQPGPGSMTRLYNTSPLRENIALNVHHFHQGNFTQTLKLNWIREHLLTHDQVEDGQSIIYCQSQREVEEILVGPLREQMNGRLVGFHGDSSESIRLSSYERFKRADASVMVSTCAFGMGVNIPTIRRVYHTKPPGRLEAMVQEAGRAGRDGRPASHHLLYTDQDFWLPQKQLEGNNPTAEQFRRAWSYFMTWEDDTALKSQKTMATEAGLPSDIFTTIVRQLREWDLISLEDQKGVSHDAGGRKVHHATKWTYINERYDVADLPVSDTLIDDKLKRDSRALRAMMAYVANRKALCRHAMVNAYFLGTDPSGKRCDNCDQCLIPF